MVREREEGERPGARLTSAGHLRYPVFLANLQFHLSLRQEANSLLTLLLIPAKTALIASLVWNSSSLGNSATSTQEMSGPLVGTFLAASTASSCRCSVLLSSRSTCLACTSTRSLLGQLLASLHLHTSHLATLVLHTLLLRKPPSSSLSPATCQAVRSPHLDTSLQGTWQGRPRTLPPAPTTSSCITDLSHTGVELGWG